MKAAQARGPVAAELALPADDGIAPGGAPRTRILYVRLSADEEARIIAHAPTSRPRGAWARETLLAVAAGELRPSRRK